MRKIALSPAAHSVLASFNPNAKTVVRSIALVGGHTDSVATTQLSKPDNCYLIAVLKALHETGKTVSQAVDVFVLNTAFSVLENALQYPPQVDVFVAAHIQNPFYPIARADRAHPNLQASTTVPNTPHNWSRSVGQSGAKIAFAVARVHEACEVDGAWLSHNNGYVWERSRYMGNNLRLDMLLRA